MVKSPNADSVPGTAAAEVIQSIGELCFLEQFRISAKSTVHANAITMMVVDAASRLKPTDVEIVSVPAKAARFRLSGMINAPNVSNIIQIR